MSIFNGRISFIIMYCLSVFATEAVTSQANLINFGGSTEEPNQAAYYLMVDSEFPKTEPADELKRTQRSFWKKLFKHGWFGEGDCNPCNYDAGNGNNYNTQPNDQPFTVFQPFRNIQQWRPFQPLFRPNCQRCGYQENDYNYVNDQGTPSYNNNQNLPTAYQDGGALTGGSYAPNEEQGHDNPSYNAPEMPPTISDDAVVSNKNTVPTYETISDAPAKINPNNIYAQAPYSKGENSLSSYENSKIPQILYQPIIYVSPQLKECAKNENCDKQTLTNDKGYEIQLSQVNVAPKKTLNYEGSKYNKAPETNSAVSQPNSPYGTKPCIGESPTVSTVSTIYTVITPSKKPTDTTYTGPSKYSLFPPKAFAPTSYGANKLSNLPTPTPSTQTCLTPLVMTMDDQPYRMCPELFDEYNRCLNKIVPSTNGNLQNAGNTFINTQLINY